MNGYTGLSYLQAEVVSLQQAERAANQLTGPLERRHRGVYRYEKVPMASCLKTVERNLCSITPIGVVATSASLLVGGIGVAGIMSTAVVEHIREIGGRMAIGANRRQILFQFLAEAVLISLLGGTAGLFVGLMLVGLLDLTTGFLLIPTPGGILTGLIISVLVGLVSGYYPARRPPVSCRWRRCAGSIPRLNQSSGCSSAWATARWANCSYRKKRDLTCFCAVRR